MQSHPQKYKIKDSFVLGLTSGFVGTVAMTLANYIRFKYKTTEVLYGHIAGSVVFAPFRLNRRKNFIIGQIFHLVIGCGFGIPLVYLFKKTGTDYHRLKGASLGLFTWGVLFNVGQKIKLFETKPRLTKTHISAIKNNLIYGLVTAETMVRLAHPSVFKQKEISLQVNENKQVYQQNAENIENTEYVLQ